MGKIEEESHAQCRRKDDEQPASQCLAPREAQRRTRHDEKDSGPTEDGSHRKPPSSSLLPTIEMLTLNSQMRISEMRHQPLNSEFLGSLNGTDALHAANSEDHTIQVPQIFCLDDEFDHSLAIVFVTNVYTTNICVVV